MTMEGGGGRRKFVQWTDERRVRDAMKTDRVDAVSGEERRWEVMWIGDQNV